MRQIRGIGGSKSPFFPSTIQWASAKIRGSLKKITLEFCLVFENVRDCC